MQSGKYVLMDFDGVIADSFSVASRVAQKVCMHLTPEEYRAAFEGNINDHDSKSLPGSHEGCAHDTDWWQVYTALFKQSVQPFSGIIPAIEVLAARYSLLIVSSGARDFIEPFLEKHSIGMHFLEILDNHTHSSKIEKMRMIFEKYDTSAADCIFITDTLGDINEANHHTMGSIGVSWGFHTRDTLEKGVPFRIVDAPAELPDAVDEYFARA